MVADRRTVTMIFTDLVGSTVHSQRLDAGAVEELREAHFGSLRIAVDTVGGTVVKNLGDGLMVVCDTPTAGLSAAVGMQQAVERSNRGAVERLAMRVGIALGEASESDGDYFGDPVVEAARLCAAAEGGQILATDVVRMVAGRHATQELVPVGALELKGLPYPVACVEVRWEPLAAVEDVGFPLPLRDLAACFEGWVPSALATCSADGTPNVAMVSQVYMVDDDHVGVTNQFFGKTTANLADNPAAAIIVTEAETFASYQLQLRFERTETAGALFGRLARSLDAIAALTGMSGVFRLRGVDIYQVLAIAQIPSSARPPPPAADGTPHG